MTGAVTGGIAIDLGATTLAACGPESLGTDLTNLLNATQNFKVHPGGEKLELILPAGGGSWFFEFAGPADTQQPPPELVPTVAVPTPAPQAPTGRVTAPAGVNVRTGPSTSYPVIGVAPFGATGEIIGRSADGQWWVARVPSAPTGQGWVSAAYVIATGADNVPVIPAPPLPPTATPAPNPTATPVPQATSTPMPEIAFWADRYDIPLGECTNLRWQVQNVSGVWVYPQGQPYQNFPQTGVSAQQVCPTATTTYEMRVLLNNGAVELRQLTINVFAVNPLANTNWALSSFTPGRVPLPNTSITLAFAANNTLSGNAGCNTYNGGYTVSGNNLRVSGVTTTLKTCGEEIDGQERQYLQALQSAAFFELSGSQLIVRDASGQEVLRFNRIS